MRDTRIKSICIQSIEMLGVRQREKIFRWLDSLLNLQPKYVNPMTNKQPSAASPPIDVVIAWVDGDDPKLAQKRSNYVHGTRQYPSDQVRTQRVLLRQMKSGTACCLS